MLEFVIMYLVIHSFSLGTAASGSYAHFGSTAEHVCLPMDPNIGPVSTTPYVSALPYMAQNMKKNLLEATCFTRTCHVLFVGLIMCHL